jgi:hypothetical protein
MSQTFRAFANQTFEPLAQTLNKNTDTYMTKRKQKRRSKLAAVHTVLICAVLCTAAELVTCEDGAERRPHVLLHPTKTTMPNITLNNTHHYDYASSD